MEISKKPRRVSPLWQTSPSDLDPISEWRAWQALSVYFAVLLNRQIRRRWELENECLASRPLSHRLAKVSMPIIFLEPVPTLHRPCTAPTSNARAKYDPYNAPALEALKTKARLLRARLEKCKELASEIERRMLDPRVPFPTHFCHTCVVDGDVADILLTKCGHRVCHTCLSFGLDENGAYECSICIAPAQFVARSPLTRQRSSSEHISNASRRLLPSAKRASVLVAPVVRQR
ncbi:hypothetical protein N7468_002449 [Penicillium chermesinum]|uniref:RING-type domain-containing protein n=1 Tax=Penicillium chermesinum TaxID=63820 RepID=A0A9W9PK62_9EURO|nr:uncharacterized protein N7468_002449 [Penicillium chermesinum]KAJ5247466.1 hypothetical protein N7468_002449 [Penicillium chermesinum]KAJ6145704.1 hypothetical protein N7470_009599 [Penicillium chermesinum]